MKLMMLDQDDTDRAVCTCFKPVEDAAKMFIMEAWPIRRTDERKSTKSLMNL